MGRVSEAQINEAIANFDYEGKLLSKEPFGSGHINDTYLLKYEISEMGILKVILQRMNREIFTNPVELVWRNAKTNFNGKVVKGHERKVFRSRRCDADSWDFKISSIQAYETDQQ